MTLHKQHDVSVWNVFVHEHSGHPLQLWGWGTVKANHGWSVHRIQVEREGKIIGGAQILVRHLPWPLKAFAYIPRGPMIVDPRYSDIVLRELADYSRTIGAVCLRVEPHLTEFHPPEGWRKVDSTILLPHTLIVDLTRDEEAILAEIPSKRRYDIRKSSKALSKLAVVDASEIESVLNVYKETAQRAGFLLHDDQYYRDIAAELGDDSVIVGGYGPDGSLVAFTWLAVTEHVAFELYGGINTEGQRLRANYGLKWFAIQTMKRRGVRHYDFNGLLNDGISEFKRNFAKETTHFVGTYEYGLSPLYWIWAKGLPLVRKVLRMIRGRGR